jgi:uncharacterized coiled-coil protein SlyX
MADQTQSLMLDILKRIQADVSDVKTRTTKLEERMTRMEDSMSKLTDVVRKQRRDTAAMLVMMRGTVGDFDDRVSVLDLDMKLMKSRV